MHAEPGIAGESAAAWTSDLARVSPALPLAIACSSPDGRRSGRGRKSAALSNAPRRTAHRKAVRVEVRTAPRMQAGRSWRAAGASTTAIARAVGPVVSLCEVGMPLLKGGGVLLLYKTESALGEMEAARNAIAQLGGEPREPYRYRLTGDTQDRLILRIEKLRDTPIQLPRTAGTPFKYRLHQATSAEILLVVDHVDHIDRVDRVDRVDRDDRVDDVDQVDIAATSPSHPRARSPCPPFLRLRPSSFPVHSCRARR